MEGLGPPIFKEVAWLRRKERPVNLKTVKNLYLWTNIVLHTYGNSGDM
jgi:hypothetical protein